MSPAFCSFFFFRIMFVPFLKYRSVVPLAVMLQGIRCRMEKLWSRWTVLFQGHYGMRYKTLHFMNTRYVSLHKTPHGVSYSFVNCSSSTLKFSGLDFSFVFSSLFFPHVVKDDWISISSVSSLKRGCGDWDYRSNEGFHSSTAVLERKCIMSKRVFCSKKSFSLILHCYRFLMLRTDLNQKRF